MSKEITSRIKQNNGEIFIYGTGNKAQQLLKSLIDSEVVVKGIIVSAGMKTDSLISGIEIYELSNELAEEKICNSLILIATAEKHFENIKKQLSDLMITEYECITEEVLAGIKRELSPVSGENLLKLTTPISRIFGLDRGTPIDRYYIEQFLRENFKAQETDDNPFYILEVGEDKYSKKIANQLNNKNVECEILDYEKGDDLTDLSTLKKDYYDLFICTQTFNFIYDVKEAIAGAYYTLKRGGIMLATVAGTITPISRYDMDRWGHYWGFTDLSAKKMFSEIFGRENVSVTSYGNVLSSTAFVQGASVEDIENRMDLDTSDKDYQIVIGIQCLKN